MGRAEWMDGICLMWSRGRLFSPSLPVGGDRYLNLSSQKATHGLKSRGKSFGTTLWHHVQRYCCLGVLFAHAQVSFNSSSYHIRGNEINLIWSSAYISVFTSFTRASFLDMRADQSPSWLIRTSFPKSTILKPFCLTIAFAKCLYNNK